MNSPEENLERLINKLHKQPLEQDMLLGLPEQDQSLLQVVAELKAIPILKAPLGIKRQKFTQDSFASNFWQGFIPSFRFTLNFSAFILVLAVGGLAYGTTKALPGQTLFSIKKSAEQFRVKFATSEIQKAYLKVQIAKKRVAEAEKISQETNKDPKQELVAIAELSEATDSAAQQVQSLPIKSLNASPEPILASLEEVSQKEKTLVSNLSQTGEDKNDVIALSLKNQIKVSEIRQSVEIAAAEEALTSLDQTPEIIVLTGEITNFSKDRLVVEKTDFILNDKTLILNSEDKPMLPKDLETTARITVTGHKVKEQIVATKITLLKNSENNKGEVKGEEIIITKPNSTTPTTLLQPTPNASEEPAPQNPNQATVNFISEDPSPQFSP